MEEEPNNQKQHKADKYINNQGANLVLINIKTVKQKVELICAFELPPQTIFLFWNDDWLQIRNIVSILNADVVGFTNRIVNVVAILTTCTQDSISSYMTHGTSLNISMKVMQIKMHWLGLH